MKKDYKNISHCRICNSKTLDDICSLSDIPIPEIYETSSQKALIKKRYPLTILRCNECKHVQISETINQSNLWNNYTYFSGQTKAIDNHFKNLSKRIIKDYELTKDDLVVDIGSNDGSFLKKFKYKTKVLGIDPAKTVAEFAINKNKIPNLISYFDNKTVQKIKKKYKKAKIILAFNVFAHTPSMIDFVKCVKKILDIKGIFIFEAQYLKDILENDILGTFFHEHISHHSVYSLSKLFNSVNLKFEKIENINIQKGSILGFVTHKENDIKPNFSVRKFLEKEKKYKINTRGKIIKFYKIIKSNAINAKKLIDKFQNISGYGAARSAPTLLRNFGIENKINYILDDHHMKIGKYTPASAIKIISTKNLLKMMPDLVVILAYLHNKKIIKKNISYLKKGGTFMILYPKPKLITKKNFRNFINA